MQRNWRELIRPKAIVVDAESLTAKYGKFVCEPLERGFGITLGNAKLHHEQVLGLADFNHKLASKMHHGGQNTFRAQGLSCAPIALGTLDEFQFVDVTGQGCLAYVEALALEPELKGVLAFDRTIVEQVEDRFVAGCLRHE